MPQIHLPVAMAPSGRRQFVARCTGLALLGPALVACDRSSAPAQGRFRGIDITGAPYGRDFSLTDFHGRARLHGSHGLSYLFDRQGRLRVALRHEQTADDYTADVKALLAQAHA